MRRDNDEPSKTFALFEPSTNMKGRGRPRDTYRAQIADLASPRIEMYDHEIEVMTINRKIYFLFLLDVFFFFNFSSSY